MDQSPRNAYFSHNNMGQNQTERGYQTNVNKLIQFGSVDPEMLTSYNNGKLKVYFITSHIKQKKRILRLIFTDRELAKPLRKRFIQLSLRLMRCLLPPVRIPMPASPQLLGHVGRSLMLLISSDVAF